MFQRNHGVSGKGTGATATRRTGGMGYGQNFHLGMWIRLHGFDILTMLLAGVAGLGVYYAREHSVLFD
jgi:hypothetical protein